MANTTLTHNMRFFKASEERLQIKNHYDRASQDYMNALLLLLPHIINRTTIPSAIVKQLNNATVALNFAKFHLDICNCEVESTPRYIRG